MQLRSLQIRNLGCIDDIGYTIDIENIVVIIGPNNMGKSSILDAYEAFASGGSALSLSKFRDENPTNNINIEGVFIDLTQDDIDTIGQSWKHTDVHYGDCIRVKWEWTQPDQKGEKYSWNPTDKTWVRGGVGGWDSLIMSRIPHPIRVRPTDDAITTEQQVTEILTSAAKEALKLDQSKGNAAFAELKKLTDEIAAEIQQDINDTTELISSKMDAVFPGYKVKFEPGVGKFEPEKMIGAGSFIQIETPGRGVRPLSQEGTGLRRTFLWSALGALAELGRAKSGKKVIAPDRPRILLIEEPESFLHPPMIKAAREALYAIAAIDGWQIITTTHSPIFIDVSKPHTSIVRVARDGGTRTRLFCTDKAHFSDEERKNLMMIRACHPTINEFFFTDHSWLVEGETEHAVLTMLLAKSTNDAAKNISVVNCLGKANLPLFGTILNQFGTQYTIIHDSDSPRAKRKGGYICNAMWTMNKTISDTVASRDTALPVSKVVAHVPNFEMHYFGEDQDSNKPMHALDIVQSPAFNTDAQYEALRNLVDQLISETHPNTYSDLSQLTQLVTTWVGKHNPQPIDLWRMD
jgi:putative ATP-dependent endonuclease of the OLD family